MLVLATLLETVSLLSTTAASRLPDTVPSPPPISPQEHRDYRCVLLCPLYTGSGVQTQDLPLYRSAIPPSSEGGREGGRGGQSWLGLEESAAAEKPESGQGLADLLLST